MIRLALVNALVTGTSTSDYPETQYCWDLTQLWAMVLVNVQTVPCKFRSKDFIDMHLVWREVILCVVQLHLFDSFFVQQGCVVRIPRLPPSSFAKIRQRRRLLPRGTSLPSSHHVG